MKRRAAFLAWLRKHKPDAVLTDVPFIREWLNESGVKVPGEVGLAVMSVLDGQADSGIDQCSFEIGNAAAEVLVSRINNEDFGESEVCREVLVRGRWVDGTTACKGKRAVK